MKDESYYENELLKPYMLSKQMDQVFEEISKPREEVPVEEGSLPQKKKPSRVQKIG